MLQCVAGGAFNHTGLKLRGRSLKAHLIINLTPVNGKNSCTLFSTRLRGISTMVVYVTT